MKSIELILRLLTKIHGGVWVGLNLVFRSCKAYESGIVRAIDTAFNLDNSTRRLVLQEYLECTVLYDCFSLHIFSLLHDFGIRKRGCIVL